MPRLKMRKAEGGKKEGVKVRSWEDGKMKRWGKSKTEAFDCGLPWPPARSLRLGERDDFN